MHTYLLLADRWDGRWDGPPWDGPGPWWPLVPLVWLLVLAAVATTAVLLARRGQRLSARRAGETRLAELYAAGQISEQEYRERRAVLRDGDR